MVTTVERTEVESGAVAEARLVASTSISENDAREFCAASLARMGCPRSSVRRKEKRKFGLIEVCGQYVNLYAEDKVLWVFEGRADGE